MHQEVRDWISHAISSRPVLIGLALRQRAKFEGWLKFELAERALAAGSLNVELEASLPSGNSKCDLAFTSRGIRYFVELKTPNTNWRMPGVVKVHRPITNNVESIIDDGRKLTSAHVNGILAFAMFPIPSNDQRWREYYRRIIKPLDINEDLAVHTRTAHLSLPDGLAADVLVASIPIEPHQGLRNA
jgi:hypothetical protein